MKEFLTDDSGSFSLMRLMMLFVVFSIIGCYIYGTIKSGAYIPMGMTEATVLSAVFASKAFQGYAEYGTTPSVGVATVK